jgi:hypothetical protein
MVEACASAHCHGSHQFFIHSTSTRYLPKVSHTRPHPPYKVEGYSNGCWMNALTIFCMASMYAEKWRLHFRCVQWSGTTPTNWWLGRIQGALGWPVTWLSPRSTRIDQWVGWIQRALGWPVTWVIPKSTGIDWWLGRIQGALGWPVVWLIPRSIGVDYTKRWYREVDNFKWTTLGPWIKMEILKTIHA